MVSHFLSDIIQVSLDHFIGLLFLCINEFLKTVCDIEKLNSIKITFKCFSYELVYLLIKQIKCCKIKHPLVTCSAMGRESTLRVTPRKKIKDLSKTTVLLNAVKEAWDGISSNAVVTTLNYFFEKCVISRYTLCIIRIVITCLSLHNFKYLKWILYLLDLFFFLI